MGKVLKIFDILFLIFSICMALALVYILFTRGVTAMFVVAALLNVLLFVLSIRGITKREQGK